MSGIFPTDPAPATATLDSNQPTAVDYSESAKRQSRILGGHLWLVKLSWSRMTRAMLAPIFSFANKQRGRFGEFTIVLPNYATPNGVGTGSPTIVGAHAAGVESLSVTAFTFSTTGILKDQDILSIAGHTKVYMCTADVNSDGAGATAIPITPPLIEALVGSEVVTVNDVAFTMSIDDDILSWKGSAPNMATVSLNLKESL